MAKSNNGKDTFRFDQRDKKTFKKDIKDATQIEWEIIKLWLNNIKRHTGKEPICYSTGCGPTGDFLDLEDVTAEADYYVEGYGPVEVKFSKKELKKYFHLKVDQVHSYIEQGANVLMVNGWQTDDKKYILIPHYLLKTMIDRCDIVSWSGFGFKPSYRFSITDFVWRYLE